MGEPSPGSGGLESILGMQCPTQSPGSFWLLPVMILMIVIFWLMSNGSGQ